jgi:endo-1,4-beta-xylanase
MNRTAIAAALAVLTAAAGAAPTLKDAYRSDFVIGAAMDSAQITGRDSRAQEIVAAQFSSVTPGNDLKWERVHPAPGVYDFRRGDEFVDFAQEHHLFAVGHVLVWHQQTPAWVYYDGDGGLLTKEALLARLKDHIFTVVGRYKGKIKAWDVVNEVIGDDGAMRQSLWYQICGEDYIVKAFQWAHEADPAAELTYNDYNIEYPQKRAGALALVKRLKAAGVPITTVGIQAHYLIGEPDLQLLDDAIADFAKLGVKVALTELDIDVNPRPSGGVTGDIALRLAADPKYNPYADGLPAEVQDKLTARYAKVFAIALKHKDVVDRVTLWGVTDADSWHNNWPIKGRTAYSLLFDRDGKPKPAVAAIIKEAQ